ncbi:MAG: nucleotidyltransferase domain-containing protein [Deferribacteres bacterium]|nr:nucleotidyltransferase domain-containing protein [Deferribacteres bacterium]
MREVENNREINGAHIDYIEKLKDVLLSFLKDEDIKVVLFGSRAREDSVNTSDVDIGIIPGKGVNRKKLILLREYIEEMNIPYKVEIVDFSTVSEEFKEMAFKEAVLWKD